MTVKLVTDSTSYIQEETLRDLDIKIVSLAVNFPGESFDEESADYDDFYKRIEREGIIPTSSQPSVGTMIDTFKEIISRGEEVLAIFISSKMSGTYECALQAKKVLLEEYPQACIEVLDSKTNCMALGLQVIEAAAAAQAGKKMEEVKQIAQDIRDKVRFYFVPATLDYLIKGGRIGGASALLGSLLKIRPILYVNDGMTDVEEKVRGTKAAIKRIIQILHEDASKYGLKHLLVHHIHDHERGSELAHNLSNLFQRQVQSYSIGPVIGLHVGPGTLGVVYCTEE
ncbi:MAG: DegV family protein [Syntrophomonadaceae bacterium]|jgi:DegV family protein with EDD domain|nr:DegV family protein [Syntrophomonadaceae bacterium]